MALPAPLVYSDLKLFSALPCSTFDKNTPAYSIRGILYLLRCATIWTGHLHAWAIIIHF